MSDKATTATVLIQHDSQATGGREGGEEREGEREGGEREGGGSLLHVFPEL